MKTDALGLNLISLSTFSAIWNFKGCKVTEKLAFMRLNAWSGITFDPFDLNNWYLGIQCFLPNPISRWKDKKIGPKIGSNFGQTWPNNDQKNFTWNKTWIGLKKSMENHGSQFFRPLVRLWQNQWKCNFAKTRPNIQMSHNHDFPHSFASLFRFCFRWNFFWSLFGQVWPKFDPIFGPIFFVLPPQNGIWQNALDPQVSLI